MTTTTSSSRELMTEAAEQVADAIRRSADADPSARTPCADFDLAGLTEHFLGTTRMLTEAAGGTAPESDDSSPWSDRLTASIDALATTWSEPSAWQGTVPVGDQQLPAPMIGDMVFAEILLHGWDVSRAAGVDLAVSDAVGAELLRGVAETAELGRTMGAYGDEVTVSDDAGDFERALAAAGRDPDWRV